MKQLKFGTRTARPRCALWQDKKLWLRLIWVAACATVGQPLAAKPPTEEAQSLMHHKKKARAFQLYGRKSYAKADALLTELLPTVQAKAERAAMRFCRACCSYYAKDYETAAHRFAAFVRQHPLDPRAEEAAFLQGSSLAQIPVDPWLDPSDTHRAIRSLERYVANHPTGNYVAQATQLLQELRNRLLEKEFEAARLYAQLGQFRAAAVALTGLERDHPDAPLRERVWRLLAHCHRHMAQDAPNEAAKQKHLEAARHWEKRLQGPLPTEEKRTPGPSNQKATGAKK